VLKTLDTQEVTMSQTVTLDKEQVDLIRAALDRADELVTMVISGQPSQVPKALAVASALNDLKRRRLLSGGK
jgi:hypothetical protein